MKLLLVTHYYPGHASGVELVAGQLAARLASKGVSITWVASGPASKVPDGVTALPMNAWNGIEAATGFAFPIWSPSSIRQLAKAVRDADVVHLHEHLYLGNLYARHVAKRSKVPVLITQHTSQIWSTPGLPIGLRIVQAGLAITNRTIGRWALGGADQVVFISSRGLAYFEKMFRFQHPPAYIPNGVDSAVFHPVDDDARQAIRTRLGWPLDKPVMLFVGRMIAKKGLPTLRGLAMQFPHVEWMLAGRGPNDPRSWNLPNVRYLGSADATTLADYYRAADLFVLPSLTEGFPLVVQESLACGTPALISDDIASGAAGVDEVVHVWQPRRETLADRLRGILANRENWPAAREKAAEYAKRWDWDVAVKEYECVMTHLVAAGFSLRHSASAG